jgi:hypothetical protein
MGMARARKKLWIDEAGSRYFLIPTTWQFPFGDLLIRSMNGYAWRIDEVELRAFEISEAQAHKHLQGKVERTFSKILNELKSNGEALPNHIPNGTPFDVTELGGAFDTFADLLEGTIDTGSDKQNQAKNYLQHVEEILKAQGQEFDFKLDSLVEEIQTLYSSTQKTELRTFAGELRTLSNMLSQPHVNLDKVVRAWETMSGGPLHLDKQRAKQDEERRKDIRASADNAIARSLRAAGFDTTSSQEN